MNKIFDWKLMVIFILAVALTFIIGRGYESRYVEELVIRNMQLEQLKLRTEQLINQNANRNARISFKQLGYNIIIPPLDTTEVNEEE